MKACNAVPVVLATAAAILAGALAGCGAAPQRRYYTLSYPVVADQVTESRPPIHAIRVRVKPFRVALPYDRPQMVYRQSAFEFNYDPYRLWASKPQQMLRELVEKHLVAQRLFSEVTRDFGDQAPSYELGAEVQAVEEYDAGDTWYGHLAIRFDLVRFSDQAVIWHYEFDRKRRVHEQKPVYVIRALSEILADEMRLVTAELDRVISQDRGVPVTLTQPPPAVDDAAPARRQDEAAGPAGATGTRTPAKPLGAGTTSTAPGADDLIVPDEGGAR